MWNCSRLANSRMMCWGLPASSCCFSFLLCLMISASLCVKSSSALQQAYRSQGHVLHSMHSRRTGILPLRRCIQLAMQQPGSSQDVRQSPRDRQQVQQLGLAGGPLWCDRSARSAM